MNPTRVCICGGGNLAHVVGGYLSSRSDCQVTLLTRHPEQWSENGSILIYDTNHQTRNGVFKAITSQPEIALAEADIILLCLPGFAIAQVLDSIKPFIRENQTVGSVVCSTGFFFMASKILGDNAKLFGFQRVPFIARINQYGHSAYLLGHKKSLAIGTKNISNANALATQLSIVFDTPVCTVDNFLKVSLTNSNPILHPSRLFTLFHNNKTYPNRILFYEEWDTESSELYIACDKEFQLLLAKLGIEGDNIPSVLSYYESSDAQSLAAKIRSIDAFKGIFAPMKQISGNTFVTDFDSRYFTEDIPYGLVLIKTLAYKKGIATPNIDVIIQWAQEAMGRQYLIGDKPVGKDIDKTIAIYL